jgi:K+-sensing histidine kinase KdpD
MNISRLKNARRWTPRGTRPLATCALGFVLALGLRSVLGPVLHESMSMLFFAINCIFISYLFGFRHAMVLLGISLPTALFLFRKPFYAFDALNQKDVAIILVYTGIITFTSLIIEWLQRERYAAVLQQRVSETRYQLLIESDQDRQAAHARVPADCGCGVRLKLVGNG